MNTGAPSEPPYSSGGLGQRVGRKSSSSPIAHGSSPGSINLPGRISRHLRRRFPTTAPAGTHFPATCAEGPRHLRPPGRTSPPPAPKVPDICARWAALPRHLRRRSPTSAPAGPHFPATCAEGPRLLRPPGRTSPPPAPKVPDICARRAALPRHLRRRSPTSAPAGPHFPATCAEGPRLLRPPGRTPPPPPGPSDPSSPDGGAGNPTRLTPYISRTRASGWPRTLLPPSRSLVARVHIFRTPCRVLR